MVSSLSGHPAGDDAVDHTTDLGMQAGVQLEPLAQAQDVLVEALGSELDLVAGNVPGFP